jgi:hypothetical protein
MTDRSYSDLSRDQLAARLRVAEDALIFIGWSSTRLGQFEGSQRGDAAEQAWDMWCEFIGGTKELDPDKHPYLLEIEPQLAATRNRIRDETLRRYFGDAS